MVIQEQKDRYNFQQTNTGKDVLSMLEHMKKQYCLKLGIPVSKIKTGKLTPLVNGYTGEIERFIEE